MKRIAQILIIIALLMIPVQIQFVVSNATNSAMYLNNDLNGSISLTQIDTLEGEESRPILMSVSNSTSGNVELPATRERNDTLGEGAIHEIGVYQNVTVQYKVVNGNENTTVRLYLDVPASNYSLSLTGNENESIVMTYVGSDTELKNHTLPYASDPYNLVEANASYYEAEFNMTEDYVTYFAAISDANRESLNAPFNFITTGNYWSTDSEDDFYIQDEDVLINLVANNSKNGDIYGIAYRTQSFGDYTNINFSDPGAVVNFEDQLNLGIFPTDVTLEWKSYAYVIDSVDSKVRYIERLDYKSVKMEDGTPSISSEIVSTDEKAIQINSTIYSRSSTLNITLNASVVKGTINLFNLTLGSNQTEEPTSATNSSETRSFIHDFVEEGSYNVVLKAITDKGREINNTYTVIIDETVPTASLDQPSGEIEIKTTSGKVSFTFNYSDSLSGVRYAILDLGDNSSVEVTGLNEFTYRYSVFDEFITITLTVVDFAGNEASSVISIILKEESLGDTNAPIVEFWLLIIGIIALIAAYIFREQLSGLLRR